MATKSTADLYEQALETFGKANEAMVMQSPCRSLLIQASVEFSQVLKSDPNWFPALFYQAQVNKHLWSSPTDLKRILQTYQHLFAQLNGLEDKSLQKEWLLKAHSERSDFLQNLNPEYLNSFAALGAIADLTVCIHLSQHYRFYVKRGRLHLMQGRLLSATEDYLLGLKRLGEFKEVAHLTSWATQIDRMLQQGKLEPALSDLMNFWQDQWVYQFV